MLMDSAGFYEQIMAMVDEGRLVTVVPVMTDVGPGLFSVWSARYRFPPSSAEHSSGRVRNALYIAHARMAHRQLRRHVGHA